MHFTSSRQEPKILHYFSPEIAFSLPRSPEQLDPRSDRKKQAPGETFELRENPLRCTDETYTNAALQPDDRQPGEDEDAEENERVAQRART